MTKINIFSDMDGVLAEYDKEFDPHTAQEKGYFKSRPVDEKMIDLINLLIANGYDVKICSSLMPGKYVKTEKNEWLDENMNIQKEKRVFVPVGTPKGEYIKMKNNCINILLDDYTNNLNNWEENGGVGLKYYNGLNGTNGTWKGAYITKDMSYEEMLDTIIGVIKEKEKTQQTKN